MKVGIYPGSFNPWHAGHQDILEKALKVFDKVIVAHGDNPGKDYHVWTPPIEVYSNPKVMVKQFETTLPEFVGRVQSKNKYIVSAIIRGLRNGHDLQYEMNQQYWYEDLGLDIPVVYFITDRSLGHISSSAIRGLRKYNVHV